MARNPFHSSIFALRTSFERQGNGADHSTAVVSKHAITLLISNTLRENAAAGATWTVMVPSDGSRREDPKDTDCV